MPLVRPRLTDYYDLAISQAECDFAIPLLDEDIPLYVDPFLLWKSPSLQDNALHTVVINSFTHLVLMFARGERRESVGLLVALSECNEVGLGLSPQRRGRRISKDVADESLSVLSSIRQVVTGRLQHIEIVQLLVDGIGKDRISDITCSILKSFLIDFTIEQSRRYRIPCQKTCIPQVYDYNRMRLTAESLKVPVSPATGSPVLLVPKRWLRYSPWISYDTYFEGGFVVGDEAPKDRVSVLLYNRLNFGLVERYVSQREAMVDQCASDPLFQPMSVLSVKRRLKALLALPPGSRDGADKLYERLAGSILASTLYPQLDFAAEQSRTDTGVLIRDVIFYNTRCWDFLEDIHRLYDSRQFVFELKNVAELNREHINQLNRYLVEQFGRFGVFLTRYPPPRHIQRNLIDLWSGQRRAIIVLSDEDLSLMVTLFESRQRMPIEVVKRAYVTFTRTLPA